MAGELYNVKEDTTAWPTQIAAITKDRSRAFGLAKGNYYLIKYSSDQKLVNLRDTGGTDFWIEGEPAKVVHHYQLYTSLNGYMSLDAAYSESGNHQTLYEGDYAFIRYSTDKQLALIAPLDNPDEIHGWWIRVEENKRPASSKLVEFTLAYQTATAYYTEEDAKNHNTERSVIISKDPKPSEGLSGKYVIIRYNKDRSLICIAPEEHPDEPHGYWLIVADNQRDQKITFPYDVTGYPYDIIHAQERKNPLTMAAGEYNLLRYSPDHEMILVSSDSTYETNGHWVWLADVRREDEKHLYSVLTKVPAYSTLDDAKSGDESKAKYEINPGKYYLVQYADGNKYVCIENPNEKVEGEENDEPEAFWIRDWDNYQEIWINTGVPWYRTLEDCLAKQNDVGTTAPGGPRFLARLIGTAEDGKIIHFTQTNFETNDGTNWWCWKDENDANAPHTHPIEIALPIDYYDSAEDAARFNEVKATGKFEAGRYYCMEEYGTGDTHVAMVSPNEDGSKAKFINLSVNRGNFKMENSDGTARDVDADPSNTGTVSGIDNKPKKHGSLTGKDPNSAYDPGVYDIVPCFVKNLVTGTVIEFRSGMPEGVSDSANPNFEAAEIRGRSNALQGYSNTESRQISFQYTFHEELEPEGLLTIIARIRALAYPGYASVVTPPKCYLRLGNVVRGTFICTNADVSYPDNVGHRDDYFLAAEVQFSFTEAYDYARSAAEIEDGGGMIE